MDSVEDKLKKLGRHVNLETLSSGMDRWFPLLVWTYCPENTWLMVRELRGNLVRDDPKFLQKRVGDFNE